MKKILSFGIAAAVLAAFFVSCSNDGGSSGADDGASEAADFAVGNEISYDGDKYLVLKNDFAESSGSSSRAVVESYSGPFYQNKNAQKVRREKIEKDYGVEKYIELFKITARKTSSKGIASLSDKYRILDENKKMVYEIVQKWSSTTMYPSISETSVRSEKFNELTENQIREYDPDYMLFYSKNLKMQIEYTYLRNDDEITVDYTKLQKSQEYKNYKYLQAGDIKVSRFVSRIQTNYINNNVTYMLCDPVTGSNFCSINITSPFISAEGDGEVGGSTSTSDWRGKMNIREITPERAKIKIEKKENNVLTEDSFSGNKWISYSALGEYSDYISVGDITENFEETGKDIPSKITFTAPFKNPDATFQKYVSVSYYPELEDGDIVYKPDYEEWVSNYEKDFESLFMNYYGYTTDGEKINQ